MKRAMRNAFSLGYARQFLRIGSAMTVVTALSMLLGMVLSILLARILGSAEYGKYFFVLSIAQMLAMPVLLGLPTLVLRQVAIYRRLNDWEGVIGVIRWCAGFAGSLMAVVCLGIFGYLFLVGELIDPDTGRANVLLLAIPLIIVLTALRLITAVVKGFDLVVIGTLPDSLIRPLLMLVVVIGVATLMGGLTGGISLMLYIASVTLALGYAAASMLRNCRIPNGGYLRAPHRIESRAWFLGVLPLSITVAADMINSRLDVVLLGAMISNEAVATYGLAVQIASLMLVPKLILSTVTGPKVAASGGQGNMAEVQRLANVIASGSFLGALFIFLAFAATGRWVVDILLGPEFQDVYAVALLLGFGNVLVSALAPAMMCLDLLSKAAVSAKIVVTCALLNAGLNVVFIPTYGAIGAAAVTVVTGTLLMVGCGVMLFRLTGVVPVAFVAKTVSP